MESGTGATATAKAPSSALSDLLKRLRGGGDASPLIQTVMMIGLIIAVLALCMVNSTFRQSDNLLNILQQASIVGIIAGGMQLMIISGGFDLSVGAVAAAAGVIAAVLSKSMGIPLAIVVGLVAGLVAGLGNGFAIAKVGINPFVATLGSAALVQGILFASTNAKPVFGLPGGWLRIGLTEIAGLSIAAVVFLVVLLVLAGVLRYTTFGQHIYAVGSNREASRRSGIRTDRVLIAVYALGGLLAALAGIVLVSISTIGSPIAGRDYALTAIAAVVIGGTPLRGGVGGIGGALVGTLILAVLLNVLTLYGVSPFWQPAATGAIVLAAVGFESYRRKRRGELL
jgi:ribose/xylose/arabinose/galactoside ABC-type transport system permease subunit